MLKIKTLTVVLAIAMSAVLAVGCFNKKDEKPAEVLPTATPAFIEQDLPAQGTITLPEELPPEDAAQDSLIEEDTSVDAADDSDVPDESEDVPPVG